MIFTLNGCNKGSKFSVGFPITFKENEENSLTKILSDRAKKSMTINFKAEATPLALRKEASCATLNIDELNPTLSQVVVICDDSNIILNSIKKMLEEVFECYLTKEERKEYEIVSLSDGVHLVSYVMDCMAKNINICLVLCDENMEYMNGSSALMLLKSLFEKGRITCDIPFYSITAFNDTSNFSSITKSGFADILGKPLTKKILLSLLQKHIKNKLNYDKT